MQLFQYHDYINVLIKPTNACNLRCKYCFHIDTGFKPEVLSIEDFCHFCDITMPYYKHVSIIWHGGEPSFVGLQNFKEYCELAKEYARKYDVKLRLSMQSNGTLLDREFLQFLKDEKIGVGISYDGPINSVTRNSTAEFAKLKLLSDEINMKLGVITVVSGLNVNSLIETYKEMSELNIPLQLNHYVKTSENQINELTLDEGVYLKQMYQLFDYWIADDKGKIQVDPLARYIRDLVLGSSNVCAHASCLRNWMCLNPDGIISPCDRDFPEEYCYGHVKEYSDIREVYNSKGYTSLIQKAIIRRTKCKTDCEFYGVCEGGCNSNALVEGGLENNGGFTCRITKSLLGYIKNKMEELKMLENPDTIVNPVVKEIICSAAMKAESLNEKY